jgi:hypothetical protein
VTLTPLVNPSLVFFNLKDGEVHQISFAKFQAFPLLPCATNGDKIESSEQGAWWCRYKIS